MAGFLRQGSKHKTAIAVEKTRRAWFGGLASLFQRPSLDEALWDELEEALVSADVGLAAAQSILGNLKQQVKEQHVTQPEDAKRLLKQELVVVLSVAGTGQPLQAEGRPLIVLVVGVNGSGKTTSIAKLAHLYQEDGKKVVLGAADTFRAAAIEQLRAWGSRLGVDVVGHQLGSDPGAVAFDTMKSATARGADVVIIDTAGRLHTKVNLMEELKKVQRVLDRQSGGHGHRVLLTMDATTGQNGLIQARSFNESIGCDGVFLAKLDGTAKGGVVVAVADQLKLPVLYIGTGEGLDDVAPFNPRDFIDALFGDRG